MKRGILIISMGDKFYAEGATNLASSLKVKNPNVKIAVLTDGNVKALPKANRDLFDKEITVKSSNPFEVKTQLCDYTPFTETLYLDADCLYIGKDIEGLMKSFEDHNLVIQECARLTKGQQHPEFVWANPDDVFKKARLSKDAILPVYNTSLIYFKKNAETKKYFTAVKKAYLKPLAGTKLIGGNYPDELAFSVASAKLEVFSDVVCYESMIHSWSPKMTRSETLSFYDFLSMAGKSFSPSMLRTYDDIASNYCRKMGVVFTKFNSRKKVFQ